MANLPDNQSFKPFSTLATNLITLAESPEALQHARAQRGGDIGFVPTMGALHAGHLSLVEGALARHQQVVVSIFVNPAQFGPHEDFERYPRTLADDLAQLEGLGQPLVVYAPAVDDLYHPGEDLRISLPSLAARWEGAQRPGHFDGVCLVLTKLFHQVAPRAVYMGQKDFQQTVVVRRLLRDLYLPIELLVVPTAREADGLAMSSRNRYLSAEHRAQAPRLHAALQQLTAEIRGGASIPAAVAKTEASLRAAPAFEIDYLSIVDGDTLEPLTQLEGAQQPTAIVTARLGTTRLLDNMPIFAAP